MGTSGLVAVTGGPEGLVESLHRRIDELESRWSRFRPTSEISRLNEGSRGRSIVVSPDTFLLISRAVEAWKLTNERFDPTVHTAMLAARYDRTFESLPEDRDSGSGHPVRSPGCRDIGLDAARRSVTLPDGVSIDPGGIGKGLAADIVASEAMSQGADGAVVDLGGDIRAIGEGPTDGHWVIDVDHPLDPDRNLLHLAVRDVAVATSSRLLRRWRIDGRPQHHLIDPDTGAPSTSTILASTVIAPECWRAEALTKSILISGRLDAGLGASALMIDESGACHATEDLLELVT